MLLLLLYLNRDRGYKYFVAVGGANIQIVHYFDHGYLEEEKSMIHSFTDTFGAKYLTGMVTSVPPYETFSLIKNNILHQSKNYKNQCDL